MISAWDMALSYVNEGVHDAPYFDDRENRFDNEERRKDRILKIAKRAKSQYPYNDNFNYEEGSKEQDHDHS